MTAKATFTVKQRNEAEALAGVGLPHSQIALLLGVDEKTLRKHLHDELGVGEAKANARIAKTLFNKAINGDTACLIFWLKVRAGWKESSKLEHSGSITAMDHALIDRPPPETREEWLARRQRQLEAQRVVLASAEPAGSAD
jgi:hypothetical protein